MLHSRYTSEDNKINRPKDRVTASAELLQCTGTVPCEWEMIITQAFDHQGQDVSACNELINDVLSFMVPLTDWAFDALSVRLDQLREALGEYSGRLERIEIALHELLTAQLFEVAVKPFVLELNIARLKGELAGASPEERFKDFSDRSRNFEAARSHLTKYPSLGRRAAELVRGWIISSLELAARLAVDYEEIKELLAGKGEPGAVQSIERTGDRHRGSRCVCIIQFQSGSKVVYKPRNLDLDGHFRQLLEWLNEKGLSPELTSPAVVSNRAWGWSEYVEARTCETAIEVERFFRRQGSFLAILHLLHGTDFHYENVIASGETPYLVDLEAIFHPVLNHMRIIREDFSLDHSVFRIGLLPQKLLHKGSDNGAVDISALGASAEQFTPMLVETWEDLGCDTMRLIKKRHKFAVMGNTVTLRGESVLLSDYVDSVAAGFCRTYDLLCSCKDELIRERLASFQDDEIRIVLRPTSFYLQLLAKSTHPDYLRLAASEDWLADAIVRHTEPGSLLANAALSEKSDIMSGDVPFFWTTPGSRNVFNSNGIDIGELLEEMPLQSATNRLVLMGADDRDRQLWIIRASMLPSPGHESAPGPRAPLRHTDGHADALVDKGVHQIAERIRKLAFQDDVYTSWLTARPASATSPYWIICPAGSSLYSGSSGIILFLAYYSQLYSNEEMGAFSRRAFKSLESHVNDLIRNPGSEATLGAFEGLGGIVYTLCHLALLWGRIDLKEKAKALCLASGQLIDADTHLDMLSGSAGLLWVMLSSLDHDSDLIPLVRRCGEHLVRSQIDAGKGRAWPSQLLCSAPLIGFSHGTSGIAVALMRASKRCNDQTFRQSAIDALSYERGAFCPTTQNWPDFRLEARQEDRGVRLFGCSWCHGAPGVALSRLLLADNGYTDSAMHSELADAIATTEALGFGANHCLCHGDLGNWDILTTIAAKTGNEELRQRCTHHLTSVLSEVSCSKCECGTFSNIEVPGLMTGLSGIGFGLLRAKFPGQVPSILSLDAPPSRA